MADDGRSKRSPFDFFDAGAKMFSSGMDFASGMAKSVVKTGTETGKGMFGLFGRRRKRSPFDFFVPCFTLYFPKLLLS